MIAIVKYNAGNISSVKNAITRLGHSCIITDDPKEIISATKVIFPGVGHAHAAMEYLKSKKLDILIKGLHQPVLGICLGQQLMCSFSEESNTPCMCIFDSVVKKFPPTDKVPHMGWNTIYNMSSDIFKGLGQQEDVYFLHSYYCEESADTIAFTDFIIPFASAMQKGNFYATQFHPEKSAGVGESILLNFLNL